MDPGTPLAVTLLFGGPSAERNISCGSLKPWATYLSRSPRVKLQVLFFDRERRAHVLPARYVYTNTCEDFESQLGEADALDEPALERLLRAQDLVVPLIHGELGEDGEVQALLERWDVPYLFSRPEALASSLDKAACYGRLAEAGLPIPRHATMGTGRLREDPAGALAELVRRLGPDGPDGPDGPAETGNPGAGLVVKPRSSGSSLGVSLIRAEPSALAAAAELAAPHGPELLVEERLRGPEFSVIVLEDDRGGPVALAPTEVVPRGAFFDERAKYLQGEAARYHTPFPGETRAEEIRAAAGTAWRALGLRHMARLDGFVTDRGVLVTDVNGVSGFGFSSFVFQQSAMIGLSHAELIERLVRAGLPRQRSAELGPLFPEPSSGRRERVHVLFGGTTSERQVSRQSGAFVGLCLLAAEYDVRFVLMDLESRFTEVGLFYALHHDVDEIQGLVRDRERRAAIARTSERIAEQLGFAPERARRHLDVGETVDLPAAVQAADACFLALHGGAGEDGTIQTALERLGKTYNGPGPGTSELCADKHTCAEAVRSAPDLAPGIRTPRQRIVDRGELRSWFEEPGGATWRQRFEELAASVSSPAFILKPNADGCSTGVKLVRRPGELEALAHAILAMRGELAPGDLGPGSRILRLPEPPPREWLIEEALVEENAVPLPQPPWNAASLAPWYGAKRFVELTCAVLEDVGPRDSGGSGASGRYTVAVPSITVAAAAELSREEKFQQGMGTNLELSLFAEDALVESVRLRFGSIARALSIEGYSRIDAFYDRQEDELILLEVNTLCGLTEATVFYSQMLAARELSPPEVLSELLRLGRLRRTP